MSIKSSLRRYFVADDAGDNPRNNNFNILRFIAAIMVIYGHMSHILGVPVVYLFGQPVSTIAVEIFFLISGYLIAKSWLSDPNLARYTMRRAFRIFPALIVVVCASVLAGAFLTTLPIREYLRHPATRGYLFNIVLRPQYSLPGVFENLPYPNAVNGSLWTLPVEFTMYFVLAGLITVFKKLRCLKPGVIVTAIVFIAASFLRLVFFPSLRVVVWGSNPMDWLPVLPFFFIGVLFAVFDWKRYLNLQWAALLIFIAAFADLSLVKSQVMLYFVLPYFVFSFAFSKPAVFSAWFANCDFSYGLYLCGFPIQQLFVSLFGTRFGLHTSTLLCTLAALALAVASWYIVEKPLQKICKKLCGAHRARHSA